MTHNLQHVFGLKVISTICLALCLGNVQSAQATTIGPTAALGGTGTDGAGNRLNVDDTNFVLLPAATYDVTDFTYDSHTSAGNAQPFLATSAGGNSYSVIWFDAYAPTLNTGNIESTSYALGTQQFTLAAPTTVYAGFNAQGPILNFTNGGSTDHANPDQPITSLGDVVASAGHSNLGRQYNFEINVQPASAGGATPEPATFALAALGLLSLGMVRRRRRRR